MGADDDVLWIEEEEATWVEEEVAAGAEVVLTDCAGEEAGALL